MPDDVLTEHVGDHILVVKLNRPAARNAVNAAVARALAQTVRESEQDDAIRVIILASSSDDIFCAGADLKEIAAGGVRALGTPEGGFAGFVRFPRSKPWIAAIPGKALGGGLELALACDMIVAGAHASFGLPEVLRGIYAGAGGVFRLPRAIPRAVAAEMLTTGIPIDAARALEIGLVNRVVPTADVLPEAVRLAGQITNAAPVAVRESLTLARLALETPEVELWKLSEALGKRLARTEDSREGPCAFTEKRPPVWQGR